MDSSHHQGDWRVEDMTKEKEIYECIVCGHKGTDVAWIKNPHKSGFMCVDTVACFERFKPQKQGESHD
jgi:hypothetical protein